MLRFISRRNSQFVQDERKHQLGKLLVMTAIPLVNYKSWQICTCTGSVNDEHHGLSHRSTQRWSRDRSKQSTEEMISLEHSTVTFHRTHEERDCAGGMAKCWLLKNTQNILVDHGNFVHDTNTDVYHHQRWFQYVFHNNHCYGHHCDFDVTMTI